LCAFGTICSISYDNEHGSCAEPGRFEATVYTRKEVSSRRVKDSLLKNMRAAFLHSAVVDDQDCLRTLKDSLGSIVKSAHEMNVLIALTPNGKGL
jgi:hypothetical protein